MNKEPTTIKELLNKIGYTETMNNFSIYLFSKEAD